MRGIDIHYLLFVIKTSSCYYLNIITIWCPQYFFCPLSRMKFKDAIKNAIDMFLSSKLQIE